MFSPEPRHQHGSIARTGVLLVNLGTPEAPTPQALRPYLKQFLSDRRVVEIPRALWWPILNLIILRTRPRKSAAKYAKIWTAEGSPLKVHTERQARLLRGYLGEQTRSPLEVEWAMRYGHPSVGEKLRALRERDCDRVLVIPLYPQYAASVTASTYDAVGTALSRMRNVPALRLVKHFHDHPGYIQALAQSVRDYWMANGRGEPNGDELPRRSTLHIGPGRPLSLRMSEDGATAGRGARAQARPVRGRVSVPLRARGMAEALHDRT